MAVSRRGSQPWVEEGAGSPRVSLSPSGEAQVAVWAALGWPASALSGPGGEGRARNRADGRRRRAGEAASTVGQRGCPPRHVDASVGERGPAEPAVCGEAQHTGPGARAASSLSGSRVVSFLPSPLCSQVPREPSQWDLCRTKGQRI